MPGYLVKQERISVQGADDLMIRSLLDRQQFSDPDGAAERLGISSAAWPLFGLLWPSGYHLAAGLAARAVVPGQRVLELGCGLALASLVAHRRGMDVTASDCHPLAAAFLLENLRLNQLPGMKYLHGQWGRALPVAPGAAVTGQFDLVMAHRNFKRPGSGQRIGISNALDPARRGRGTICSGLKRLDWVTGSGDSAVGL